MKTKSKEELKATAQKVFKQYKKAKKVFATLDGNVFLDKNRAELHAGKDTVLSFSREDLADKPKEPAQTAKTKTKQVKKPGPKLEKVADSPKEPAPEKPENIEVNDSKEVTPPEPAKTENKK